MEPMSRKYSLWVAGGTGSMPQNHVTNSGASYSTPFTRILSRSSLSGASLMTILAMYSQRQMRASTGMYLARGEANWRLRAM
jgi:hypothetical protein